MGLPDHQLQYLHRPCLHAPSVQYLGLVYEWRLMFDTCGNQWLWITTKPITQYYVITVPLPCSSSSYPMYFSVSLTILT